MLLPIIRGSTCPLSLVLLPRIKSSKGSLSLALPFAIYNHNHHAHTCRTHLDSRLVACTEHLSLSIISRPPPGQRRIVVSVEEKGLCRQSLQCFSPGGLFQCFWRRSAAASLLVCWPPVLEVDIITITTTTRALLLLRHLHLKNIVQATAAHQADDNDADGRQGKRMC